MCALPNVSSIGEKVSPQRVYVEDGLSTSLFVPFTESSHGIQCARASVRGTAIVLITVEMAGCRPRKESNFHKSSTYAKTSRYYAPRKFFLKILNLFHRNDHHIETTCRAQHFGRCLEGKGHRMTLQQNRVRLITSLFEVGF